MLLALKAVEQLDELYRIDLMIDFVTGKETKQIKDYHFNERSIFGTGKDKDENFWSSVYRQAMLHNLVYKDVETYGLLKLTDEGRAYMEKPHSIKIPMNHDFSQLATDYDDGPSKTASLDDVLLKMLKDLRRKVAKQKNVPPFVVFQDPSLSDMATAYPVTMDEMANISGGSKGKAIKYARPFLDMISEYVEANEIDRPSDFVMKQVANKSKVKVNIIQGIDRKIPLHDIAGSNNLSMEDILQELDAIVTAGTKVNLDYYIEDAVDEYSQEDIYDYFMEAETDNVDIAFKELHEDDITLEEIQLMRIKFLSEMAN